MTPDPFNELINLLLVGLEDETDLSGSSVLKPRRGVGLEDAKARPSGTAERQSLSSPAAQFTLPASDRNQTTQNMTAPDAGII